MLERWSAEQDFLGDIVYAWTELKKNFREVAAHGPPPSFSQVFKDYWFSVARIAKRFFTRNVIPPAAGGVDQTPDTRPEPTGGSARSQPGPAEPKGKT